MAKRIILGGAKSKTSVNADSFINVELDGKRKLLPPDKINRIVDAYQQFESERQLCTTYRLLGTITPVFTNVLFNINGKSGPTVDDPAYAVIDGTCFGAPNGFSSTMNYGWETFTGCTFITDPFESLSAAQKLTYPQSIATNLKEINGWFGFYDPDPLKEGECLFYDLEPTRKRFDLNSITDNWLMRITYPKYIDKTHILVNGGLLVTNALPRTFGGRDLTAFGTAVPHNLSVGDTVRLNIGAGNADYTVLALGLNNGDSQATFFVVNIKSVDIPTGDLFPTGRMKRLFYGNEVEYYIRKFRRLDVERSDYEIYQLAFSKSLYDDQIYQFVVNKDINISGKTDHLNRPLSELYVTFVKRDSNGTFTNLQAGFDLENYYGNVGTETIAQRQVANIRKMHRNTSPSRPFDSHVPLNVNNIGLGTNIFYGDVVEYSRHEVKETILQDVVFRFNTKDRETTILSTNGVVEGPRNEGYFYKPHHRIQIRQFSNYVEQGDSTTSNIPSYAEPFDGGTYLWRDLLDIGYDDGQTEPVDYPFLNNAHYLHQNYCLMLKRQDPFNEFGLYYDKTYPNDIGGDGLTDVFTVNFSDDGC